MKTTTDRDGFEIETCTRCGGSGQFSSCATHGTRCFKCNGAGNSHTVRGAAAVAFLKSLRSRTVESVVVGELVWVDAGTNGKMSWQVVTAVDVASKYGVAIECGPEFTTHNFPGSKIVVKLSTDEAARTLAIAIDYQAGLTKAGKPSKRAA